MRKLCLLSTLVLTILACSTVSAQDFSNKGKEFWLCFPQHVPSSNNATLSIFITSDRASTGTITMPNGAFSATFNIAANGIQEIQIPWSPLIHISNAESNTILNKSIRIKTDPNKPAVVAYAQQWAGARSTATLLLPMNVLGKKYRTISFTQNGSNNGGFLARSQFQIIAVKDNTVVEITPFKNGVKGTTFTITLPVAGSMYQYQSTDGAAASQDLSGTFIESKASGSGGCNPIAVFSGSSNITFGTPSCNGSSFDPLWQQNYPISTWGKNYGLIPFADYPNGVPYRVMASEDNTTVYFNGSVVATINAGQIFPTAFTSNPPVTTAPVNITADKPICVAEYAQADACTGQPPGPGRVGDPDMVILNPIEQNIRDINIFSSSQQNITKRWINILLKTVAIPSFRISYNGGPLNPPAGSWVAFASLPGYSYLKELLGAPGSYRLLADSGFNATAYGWGNVESYAYSAGTNVRDLYQQIGVKTQYGIEPSPSVCTGAPFQFKVSLPYCADSIEWDLSGLPVPPVPPRPKIIYNTCVPGAGGPDSTTVVNGKTLYWYSIPTTYVVNTVGIYPITIIVYTPNTDGCGSEQDIDFDLEVSNPPVADFTFFTDGCAATPIQFNDATISTKPTYSWWWSFGDPASGANNNSNLKNPIHLFSGPGTYTVRYSNVTTPGCLSDTIEHQVVVDLIPTAQFAVATNPLCVNQPITFNDLSVPGGSATLVQWVWNFGDASPVVVRNTSTNEVHTYTTPGTYNVTLRVTTAAGCNSIIFSLPVTIEPNGTVALSSAPGTDNQTICINTPLATISYTVGGSGTGGNVTGLPAGVTGSYAGGVITITGTPTIAGVFNYTVNTTGPCVNPTATGTITVTADGTATLSSAPGTDNQTICINTPITDITYAVGGSGTGGNVTGLPTGVTGSYAGGVITITGTPTVSGTFNYTVTTTGPCISPSASGTITVTADGTITLSSAPGTNNQTICINVPIVNITYVVAGSGTGGSVTGLPAGVTGSFAGGVITISGTPTVSGVFNYTVNTTGPCSNPTATGTITVTANGTVTLSSAPGTDNQTVCINAPITTITYTVGGSGTGGNVTGLPAGVNGIFAGGVISITGSPTVAGVFNYTVNTTGPCVTPTTTGTITVTADGTITLSSAVGTDNQSVCINMPITNIRYTVGGSGTGGSVSGLPAGVTGSFAAGVITITGTPTVSGVFNYTVSTTGPCGTPTATGTITVDPDATITLTSPASSANQELCINATIANITYSVGGTGTGGTVSGLPPGVTGSFAGGVFTITGSPTASGIFNYTVTTTGICAAASATGTITVNALPTANFTNTSPSCETRVISFTDASIPNSGNIISWSWDFGDASPLSNLRNPTHTYAASGTYTVTLIVTTDKGCISTTPPRQITINNRPTANYVLPEVCLNDTFAQFTDASNVSPPDVVNQWEWDFGDGSPVSNLQNPTHGYLSTGSFNVRLVATSNMGCRDTIIQPIFVNGSFPLADFTVQNPGTLCANDSVSIVEASTVFPGTITKVEIYWDNIGAPGTFDIDNSPVTGKVYKHKYPTLTTTQNYTIRYRAYSGGVCVNDKFRIITVNAAPDVIFNAMPSICYDAAPWQIPPAIARETGGVVGTGVFTGPGVSTSGLFTPSVAGIGTHRILYTYTSTAAGCVDTASNLITVWDTASAKIDLLSSLCERSPVSFTSANSTLPAGNGTITGWTWNFGDPASGPLNTSNATAPTHLFTGWGSYTVTLSVTTSNGCRSTLRTLPVMVNPIARPDFTFPAISCLPNASVAFTNRSTIPDGTQSAFSYLWNFDDPPSGPVNTSTGKDPSHTYVGTGPYNVNLQVTSGAGCVHDTTIVLNSIHPQPQASFTTDKIDVCVGGSISFTNTSNPMDGTTTSWNWDLANGTLRAVPVFTYTYPVAGVYDVSLYIFNSFNCKSNVFVKTVSVNPFPPVNAGPSKFMLEGGQVQLTPSVNVSYPITYSWSPGRYLNDSTLSMPIARPPDDMYFKLTVTSYKGCSAWDTMFVKVLKKPDIPNIFSPNGDGVNDKWVIKYLDSYPGCAVQIVNRYGQLVYKSVGYSTPWDGKINGTDAPIGTYYYVVDPKNGRMPITGYVDIIR